MTRRTRILALLALALATAPPALAQPPMAQDSTLNNLVHDDGYATAPLGSLGAVVERGKGPVDMVLVSGFGVGASAFEGFMARNANRYRMVAITLPGFEGTAAPPMPPAGTSYGEQTWTRAATEAVVGLIREKGLRRPIVVGHFVNGTQVAMRIALDHPELVRGVVLVAGTPRYEPPGPNRWWPVGLTLDRKIKGIDQGLAPYWFKTVTRATWVSNNFVGSDYSVDAARGERAATRANDAPLPVLIRYLCEFHASDLWPELDRVTHPLLLLQPRFVEAVRADTTRNYLQGYFETPWAGRLEKLPAAEVVPVDDAGILVLDDQPALVDRRIAAWVKRVK